ncbi:MAG: peptidoglycan-N-acetylglucosamine deacetylase [Bacillota bacterium]|nr:peptidoglycan-N-acetylglucosamine deacetylase [Bacillota bacterium]
MRRRLAGLGAHLSLVGSRRAHLAVIVAVLVMASGGAVASRVGAQSEVRASEVTVLPGSYGGEGEGEREGEGGGEHQVPRRPDVYVFGFILDGSMMVPVRPAAEAYGATVHWVAGVGTLVNGRLVETATVLSQAYSPARELAAVLGCWLEWDQVARTVILSNGIQRVIVSAPAGSWVEEGVAPGEASGTGGMSAGPGTGGPGAVGAAHAAAGGGAAGTLSAGTTAAAVPGGAAGATTGTTAGTAAPAGVGRVIGTGEAPGMTGGAGGGAGARIGSGSGTGPGTGDATAAGPGSGGSGLFILGGAGESGTMPGVITVTAAASGTGTGRAGTQAAAGLPGDAPQPGAPVVTIASLPSAGSPDQPGSPGWPGGGAPVVVITPLPAGPASPPSEGPDGDGTAGAAHRGPEGRLSAGKIALTFDDGPDAVYTKKILSVLDRYRVKATFFLIGNRVERHSAVVREMAAAGHELGNHGYSHSRLTTLSAEAVRREISSTQEAVKAAANVTPRWFRPPYGSYNDEVRQIAKEEGATTVLWTLNPDDWRNPGQAAIVQRVTSGAKDGAIVLLHVREQTARALPALIEGLRSRGYELVLLSALFSGDGERPALRTEGGQDGAGRVGSSPEPAGQPQGAPAGPASGTGAGAADAVTGATGAE